MSTAISHVRRLLIKKKKKKIPLTGNPMSLSECVEWPPVSTLSPRVVKISSLHFCFRTKKKERKNHVELEISCRAYQVVCERRVQLLWISGS